MRSVFRMTRINTHTLASALKEHWLSAPPLPITDKLTNAVEQLNVLLLTEIDECDCNPELLCTGTNAQPYANVEELRRDYRHGLVLYRSAGHPLGPVYDKFRALHDVKHHCVDGFCFGLRGEIASAGSTLELILHSDGVDYCDLAVSLVMSDVAAPNAAYYVDNDWGDYDYHKIVEWPPHLVSQVIELGRHYREA